MTSLALLIYLTGFDFRLMDWESKINPKEVPSGKGIVIPKEPIKTLMGMIKIHRAVNINDAAKLLRISPDEVRVLLYSLAAEDKIKGDFDGETFRIISDVDEFVAALDQQFRQ